MKEGWEVKRLEEIIESNVIGLTKSSKEQSINHKYKYVKMNNITRDNCFDLSKYTCVNATDGEASKYYLLNGDFLFNTRNSYELVGKTCLYEGAKAETILYNNNIMRIRFLKSINPYFINYAFSTDEVIKKLGRLKSGTTNVSAIYYKDLKNLELQIPPLPEQHRIVAILDEAFAAITKAKANAEQNLKNAKELFKSYLEGIFKNRDEGWEVRPFSELCHIKHGFAFEGKYFSDKGEYVLLTPGNFFESGGYRNRGDKQKYYIGEVPQDYVLKKGDLLVAMTEQAAGLLGSPILVPESNKFLHNQRLGLVIPKEGIPWTNEFFFHVFNTREVREILHATGTGVKVRHTSPTKIGEVLVRYPTSINAQADIVDTLENLNVETKKLEAIYQKKIDDLEELKKSILQKAFSGELKTLEAVAV